MDKYRKTLAWILRNESFHFDKDKDGFIPILEVIEEYNSYIKTERNRISQDAYFCAYQFRPYEHNHYKIVNKFPKEMSDTFVHYYMDIMPEDEYNRLLENYLAKYAGFPILTPEIILRTAEEYSDQFLIKGDVIRAIRSWENK